MLLSVRIAAAMDPSSEKTKALQQNRHLLRQIIKSVETQSGRGTADRLSSFPVGLLLISGWNKEKEAKE